MTQSIGTQYAPDDKFKAAARLHQSRYRADVLNVGYDEYGNRLKDEDARKLLNYYDGLNVRAALRARYPSYSKKCDADMLRSEHIPFNLFAPLEANRTLAKEIVQNAFKINCKEVSRVAFEYAPEPKQNYLNDGTAFDVYIEYQGDRDQTAGIGIEVKYTEKDYPIGITEKKNVENPDSRYWRVTRASRAFIDDTNPLLGSDAMRQIWRNHLLACSMVQRSNISEFTSLILYPKGNDHFGKVIPGYRSLMHESERDQVRGCTYQEFISHILIRSLNSLHFADEVVILPA
jgi:hypothetical protein